MSAITINLPKNVAVDSFELTMLVASRLYEKGKLSLGQAAEVANMSKRTFIELLGHYGVSVFNYPSNEIFTDIAHA
jgi:predicted HTH domain antitoxin